MISHKSRCSKEDHTEKTKMKTFVFVIFAFVSFNSLHAAPRVEGDLADRVQQVIDGLLAAIPATAALKDMVINVPVNNIENGQIAINEISLSGLKTLDTKLNYDDAASRLDYVLSFGEIAVVVDFTLHLEGFISVDNHLSVHVDLKDLKNEGYAVVSSEPKEVTDFNIVVTIGEANFDIKGLLNNDELSETVTQLLNDNVAKIVNEINPVIAPFFSRIVKNAINIALNIEV